MGKSHAPWGNSRCRQLDKPFLSTIHSPYYYHLVFKEEENRFSNDRPIPGCKTSMSGSDIHDKEKGDNEVSV
jgi:hypothetical protein